MAKKAVIENNVVVNVIEVWEPPEGMVLVDLEPNVGIGWAYVDGGVHSSYSVRPSGA